MAVENMTQWRCMWHFVDAEPMVDVIVAQSWIEEWAVFYILFVFGFVL